MNNTFGTKISVTIFGESHGPAIGCVVDGLQAGLPVDPAVIDRCLAMRRPQGAISTARREADRYTIESGVYEGRTTGTPVCIVIPNEDTRSADYEKLASVARPSHADYAAFVRYNGANDTRGGGHFSGRITAAVVAAGALLLPALQAKGILIGTHIAEIAGITDREFGCGTELRCDLELLSGLDFAVLDAEAGKTMQEAILAAKADADSVGGILETAVTGLPAGLGEPFFDSVEGLLSHALFAIPGIKGIEFGAGFGLAKMRGSEANDPFRYADGRVVTTTNNAGGINGGLTNGMPILFRCAVRPTPTIGKEQETVNFRENTEVTLAASGRHDPCIAHRVRAVVDAMTAIVIADLLAGAGKLQ
ncbi:MAG: chorismate synthase [Lachnospiraceae bacterium]|nr:chorismate synthase [Lachnospiraceae bacterium]